MFAFALVLSSVKVPEFVIEPPTVSPPVPAIETVPEFVRVVERA